MTIFGIYILIIVLKMVGVPVIREISWPWIFLWPLVAAILMFVIRIIGYILAVVFTFGFLWMLYWLWTIT